MTHSAALAVAAATKPAQAFIADREGERLDRFLARSLPDSSRAAAQRLIDAGQVLVDGKPARAAHRLHAKTSVNVQIPAPQPSALTPEAQDLAIVYEDRDLLVVDKPCGVVVHPGAGHHRGTLVHGLLAHCTDLSGVGGELRPGVVHRLDRDTSGLLLVAKHDAAHRSLSTQLAQRTVAKHYLCLLDATPREPAGVIDAPIGRDPRDRQRMAIVECGRAARTGYRVLAVANGLALTVVRLETGRTHQIRVHFAAIGCPVSGDTLYGHRDGDQSGRLWLHAWRLAFDHPQAGVGAKRLALEAPLPAELSAALPNQIAAASLDRVLATARRWAQAAEQAHDTAQASVDRRSEQETGR